MISLLEELAEATWQRLGEARRFDVRFGEETLTDLIALEWARSDSTHLKLHQTTKADEAIRGTDIEVRVGVGRGAAIVLAIQAKRLHMSTARYDSLNPLVGNTRRRQIDVFETYSKQVGARPLYLLYNYVKTFSGQSVWHCERPLDRRQLGCTLVPLARVREVLGAPRGRRTFLAIHTSPDAIPWRCIECPSSFDPKLPCTKTMDERSRLLALAEVAGATEGAWPEWLWERTNDAPLSESELAELHGGHEVRLPEEPAAIVADSRDQTVDSLSDRVDRTPRSEQPRLVPRRVLLVDLDWSRRSP